MGIKRIQNRIEAEAGWSRWAKPAAKVVGAALAGGGILAGAYKYFVSDPAKAKKSYLTPTNVGVGALAAAGLTYGAYKTHEHFSNKDCNAAEPSLPTSSADGGRFPLHRYSPRQDDCSRTRDRPTRGRCCLLRVV